MKIFKLLYYYSIYTIGYFRGTHPNWSVYMPLIILHIERLIGSRVSADVKLLGIQETVLQKRIFNENSKVAINILKYIYTIYAYLRVY